MDFGRNPISVSVTVGSFCWLLLTWNYGPGDGLVGGCVCGCTISEGGFRVTRAKAEEGGRKEPSSSGNRVSWLVGSGWAEWGYFSVS